MTSHGNVNLADFLPTHPFATPQISFGVKPATDSKAPSATPSPTLPLPSAANDDQELGVQAAASASR